MIVPVAVTVVVVVTVVAIVISVFESLILPYCQQEQIAPTAVDNAVTSS